MAKDLTTELDDVMAPLMKYLATQDATLGIYPTTLDEFEAGVTAKAALSAMVENIIGEGIKCDGTCEDGYHSGQKHLLDDQCQRAIAKGFDLQESSTVND